MADDAFDEALHDELLSAITSGKMKKKTIKKATEDVGAGELLNAIKSTKYVFIPISVNELFVSGMSRKVEIRSLPKKRRNQSKLLTRLFKLLCIDLKWKTYKERLVTMNWSKSYITIPFKNICAFQKGFEGLGADCERACSC